MKCTTDRPYGDPGKAARRLLEHAHAFEPVQDGRIYIEKRALIAPSSAVGSNCMIAGRS